jgi:hypothetical protein
MAEISKIKLFRERMESDVKPHLDDEVFEGLMDLLHLAIIEAYEKGRRADDGRD